MHHRSLLPTVLLALALAAGPVAPAGVAPGFGAAALQAQEGEGEEAFHPSAYLPLDHWAYPLLDHWISTGRVESLSPFTRPYRRMDVARALRELDLSQLTEGERGWLERLRREFRLELDRLAGTAERENYVQASFELGGTLRSQDHRDLLRPVLEGPFSEADAYERLMFAARGRMGPVVGAFRGGRDRRYVNDAQFPDGQVIPRKDFPIFDQSAIRVDDGYTELQTEYARIYFGNMDRDWGPPGALGFVRSGYSYSYEELAYRFGTDRFFLTGNVTALDDARGDTVRYFTSHRLEVRPVENLMLAVTEGMIHGGPSGTFDPALANPLDVWHRGRTTAEDPKNPVGQLDVWWRPTGGLALYGSLVTDATNLGGAGDQCCQLGGLVGAEAGGLLPGWLFRLNVGALQSLVYRGNDGLWEEWSVDDIGLGWDKNDLYLVSLEGQWVGQPGLVLRPRLDVQARGEESEFHGRLRPPGAVMDTFPQILAGEAELTVRPALAGRWHRTVGDGWSVDVEWDVGVNFIRDHRHVAGDDRTELVGRLRAVVRTPRLLFGVE